MLLKLDELTLMHDILVGTDVNECEESLADCDHLCHNSEGSYTCSCKEGYALDANERSCTGKYQNALTFFPTYEV